MKQRAWVHPHNFIEEKLTKANFSLKIFLPKANAQSLYKFHFIHHVFTIILSIPRKFHSLSKTRPHDKTIHRFLSSPVPLTSISVLTLVHDKPLYIYTLFNRTIINPTSRVYLTRLVVSILLKGNKMVRNEMSIRSCFSKRNPRVRDFVRIETGPHEVDVVVVVADDIVFVATDLKALGCVTELANTMARIG